MIESVGGKLYTGITNDIERRFDEHKNSIKKRAKFFRIDPPLKVVYTESLRSRGEALKREAQIKKLSRTEKLMLLKEST